MYGLMIFLVFAILFAFIWVAISSRRTLNGYGESYEVDSSISAEDYRQADERIREEILDRLIAHEHEDVDPKQIKVTVEKGEVTLTGRVPSKRARHMVEDLAYAPSGVYHVWNHLVRGDVHRKAS